MKTNTKEYKGLYIHYTMHQTNKFDLDLDTKNEKIIEKIIKVNENGYKILKYDEKYVCDNDENLGKYRSIVLSDTEGRMLCYSPPKSITLELFKERYPQLTSDILVNEVIEGTMISLFWDDRIDQWEIATKGSVGGNYWFYRTKYPQVNKSTEQITFRRMFLDALRASPEQDLNDLALLDSLPKGNPTNRICYNFVLQHPENPIVLVVEHPRLFLVSVYEILSSIDRVIYVDPDTYYAWNVWDEFSGMVEFPSEDYDTTNGYDAIQSNYCAKTSNANSVGLMITNVKNGDRTCIENAAYAEKKELRGNNPNLQYEYLCLKKIDKVEEFVNTFPNFKKCFFRFHKQYEEYVTQLHQSYFSYYVKKSNQNISKKYFQMIYKLHHEVYLPSLAGEKKIMKRSEVKKWLIDMPPSEVIYYLNYEDT